MSPGVTENTRSKAAYPPECRSNATTREAKAVYLPERGSNG